MKKIVSLVLVSVMLVGMLFALTACGKTLSGSYEAELSIFGQSTSTTYTFKGSKVEVVNKTTVLGTVNTTEFAGTYEITENDDGTMEITLSFETEDDTVKSGTYTFVEGEDYIKIGGVQYNKK